MFGDQASRLLRKTWPDPNQLAQELYAMFQDDIAVSTNAPFTINQPPGSPGLIIQQGPAGANGLPGINGVSPPAQPALQIDPGTGGTIQLGDVIFNVPASDLGSITLGDVNGGSVTLNIDGSVNLGNGNGGGDINFNGGNIENVTNINGQPVGGGGGGGGGTGSGGGFPGTVQSGSGNTYKVQIKTGSGTSTVTVTQVQIDPDETIPTGSGCTVVQVGSAYFMQVAVWQ